MDSLSVQLGIRTFDLKSLVIRTCTDTETIRNLICGVLDIRTKVQGRTEANLRFGPNTKKAPLCIAQFPWEFKIYIVSQYNSVNCNKF
jgi:hypothetical protein